MENKETFYVTSSFNGGPKDKHDFKKGSVINVVSDPKSNKKFCSGEYVEVEFTVTYKIKVSTSLITNVKPKKLWKI